MFNNTTINIKRSKMQNNHISTKESLYLIYAYVSISTFLLMGISKITKNLERVLDFHPMVSIAIILNMVLFISLYYYKKKHSTPINQNNF